MRFRLSLLGGQLLDLDLRTGESKPTEDDAADGDRPFGFLPSGNTGSQTLADIYTDPRHDEVD